MSKNDDNNVVMWFKCTVCIKWLQSFFFVYVAAARIVPCSAFFVFFSEGEEEDKFEQVHVTGLADDSRLHRVGGVFVQRFSPLVEFLLLLPRSSSRVDLPLLPFLLLRDDDAVEDVLISSSGFSEVASKPSDSCEVAPYKSSEL